MMCPCYTLCTYSRAEYTFTIFNCKHRTCKENCNLYLHELYLFEVTITVQQLTTVPIIDLVLYFLLYQRTVAVSTIESGITQRRFASLSFFAIKGISDFLTPFTLLFRYLNFFTCLEFSSHLVWRLPSSYNLVYIKWTIDELIRHRCCNAEGSTAGYRSGWFSVDRWVRLSSSLYRLR